MNDPVLATDSLVTFQNNQGSKVRGTLIRLTRNSAVFEVYNPYSVVQLSEVLTGVRIGRGDRTIYAGTGVVSNLVSTGLLTIVSLTLLDPWSDLVELVPGSLLRDEVCNFVNDWEYNHCRLRPSYELTVVKFRHFLEELSRWIEHGEALAGMQEPNVPEQMVVDFVSDIESVVASKLDDLIAQLEREAVQVSDDELPTHKAFARRELHPFMLCSPFMHRAYTKPLGYAGDYEMVNMIIRDPREGRNTYAKLVNAAILRSDTAQAHRNRIVKLLSRLRQEAKRVAAEDRVFRVLNIGCGPADEIRQFVSDPCAYRRELTLIDFNKETLDYAMAHINASLRPDVQNTRVEFLHRSIHDLLKRASQRHNDVEASYDMVYCAGLFDYMSDRICRRLLKLFYDWTIPGGLVVATNVHTRNPIRRAMEHVTEWYLVHRDEADMLAMASKFSQRRVVAEDTGTNVFLEIRKPDSLLEGS